MRHAPLCRYDDEESNGTKSDIRRYRNMNVGGN